MKNILGKAKIWLIVALCIVVVGTVFTCVFGLNNSVAIAKDTFEVHISTEIDFDKNTEVIEETAEEFFKDKKLHVASDYLLYNYNSHSVYVFRYALSDSEIAGLQETIDAVINPDGTANPIEITVTQYEATGVSNQKIWPAVITTAVCLVIIGLYLMIRYRFAASFTVMLSAIISCLLFVAMTAITRAVVVPAYYAIVLAGILLTVFSSITFVGRSKSISAKYTELQNAKKIDVASKLECGNVKLNLAIIIATVIVAVAFAIFGPASIRWAGLTVAIMGITTVFTNVCLVPTLWVALASVGKNKKA